MPAYDASVAAFLRQLSTMGVRQVEERAVFPLPTPFPGNAMYLVAVTGQWPEHPTQQELRTYVVTHALQSGVVHSPEIPMEWLATVVGMWRRLPAPPGERW